MHESFFLHLFPPQYRVLGQDLPPLSLWHLAALEAIESPFLGGKGAQIQLGDLQAAVRVCLTRWPDQPEIRPRLRDWWQQLRYRTDERYLRQHAKAFHAYLQLHCTPPEIWEDEEGIPRTITAPSVLSRVAALSNFPAFTLDAIWNDVTPGYALWLLCANAERETGRVRFASDEDDALPDLEQSSEEELYELAVRELGKARADVWLAARIKNQKENA